LLAALNRPDDAERVRPARSATGSDALALAH
jgi:hypothetical protein